MKFSLALVFSKSYSSPNTNKFVMHRNPWVAVDSFFVLSGCLLSYLTMKELDRSKGRLNIPFFYLHRYIRLTGVYAFVVGFNATLWKFFNWGPRSRVQLQVLYGILQLNNNILLGNFQSTVFSLIQFVCSNWKQGFSLTLASFVFSRKCGQILPRNYFAKFFLKKKFI